MLNTWKAVWVVLSEDALEFYKKKTDRSPKGMIPLKGATLISPCQDFGKRTVRQPFGTRSPTPSPQTNRTAVHEVDQIKGISNSAGFQGHHGKEAGPLLPGVTRGRERALGQRHPEGHHLHSGREEVRPEVHQTLHSPPR